ncbi:hypothetical protein DIPPA_70071 [Diplonema papillatum]|nr:hypothetical protein DIPPA_17054 [Diplonema papillatum]KAJ9473664.1 hypothetical protein DIPPA_70071 [Diplonema papillatum]
MMRGAALLLACASAHAFTWEHDGEAHSGALKAVKNPTICDEGVKQYAGFYSIDNSTKNYFFWAFEARNKTASTPTILWMTGGPGCSSELAILFENGPCKVNEDGKTTTSNPYSWNQNANVVYIDQPAGVGFSYGAMTDKDESGVARDMYAFLQDFFKDHPSWNTNFFVFGESYGGHYAPATAHGVLVGNNHGAGLHINLTGLAVGNGLTDPQIQYEYYAQDAYNWSIAVQGHPAVTLEVYEKMVANTPACIAQIQRCNENAGGVACAFAKTYCNEFLIGPYSATGLNPYDMREKCTGGPLCYNFTAIDTYLNSKAVQEQLGVDAPWASCSSQVTVEFTRDWMVNYQTLVRDLLAGGVRTLIYAGDVDFICNWLGNRAWTLALNWPHKAAFNAAPEKPWAVDGKTAGVARTANGLTFLQVHNAGHMVPHDQPAVALEMVDSFLFGREI